MNHLLNLYMKISDSWTLEITAQLSHGVQTTKLNDIPLSGEKVNHFD